MAPTPAAASRGAAVASILQVTATWFGRAAPILPAIAPLVSRCRVHRPETGSPTRMRTSLTIAIFMLSCRHYRNGAHHSLWALGHHPRYKRVAAEAPRDRRSRVTPDDVPLLRTPFMCSRAFAAWVRLPQA